MDKENFNMETALSFFSDIENTVAFLDKARTHCTCNNFDRWYECIGKLKKLTDNYESDMHWYMQALIAATYFANPNKMGIELGDGYVLYHERDKIINGYYYGCVLFRYGVSKNNPFHYPYYLNLVANKLCHIYNITSAEIVELVDSYDHFQPYNVDSNNVHKDNIVKLINRIKKSK